MPVKALSAHALGHSARLWLAGRFCASWPTCSKWRCSPPTMRASRPMICRLHQKPPRAPFFSPHAAEPAACGKSVLADAQRLPAALQSHRGNVSAFAKAIGVSRMTVYRYFEKIQSARLKTCHFIWPSEKSELSDGLDFSPNLSAATAQLVGRILNPTFGHRPKRCVCLVLRTSVGSRIRPTAVRISFGRLKNQAFRRPEALQTLTTVTCGCHTVSLHIVTSAILLRPSEKILLMIRIIDIEIQPLAQCLLGIQQPFPLLERRHAYPDSRRHYCQPRFRPRYPPRDVACRRSAAGRARPIWCCALCRRSPLARCG